MDIAKNCKLNFDLDTPRNCMITSQQQKSTFFFYHVGIFEVTPFEKKAKNLRFLAFEVTCMLICQLNLFADGFFWWLIKMIFTNLKKKKFSFIEMWRM